MLLCQLPTIFGLRSFKAQGTELRAQGKKIIRFANCFPPSSIGLLLLCASAAAPLRRYAAMPLRRYTATPLHRYAATPLKITKLYLIKPTP